MRIQAVESSRGSSSFTPLEDIYRQITCFRLFVQLFFARVHVQGCYVARLAPRGGRQEAVGRGEGGSKSAFRRSRASISRVHFGRSLAASGHV